VKLNITRRQFLQYCTASAAALGLSQTDLLKLEKALATPQTGCGSPSLSVIWLSGQACSGCPVSLLNRIVQVAGGYYDADLLNPLYSALAPFPQPPVGQGAPTDVGCNTFWQDCAPELSVVNDVADLVVGDAVGALVPAITPRALAWAPFSAGYITVEWNATIMASAGDIPLAHMKTIADTTPFVLLLDGAVPVGGAVGGIPARPKREKYCYVFDNEVNDGVGGVKIEPSLPLGPTTVADALRWLGPKAAAAISVGTCASFGGIPAARNTDLANRFKTGAKDLQTFFNREGIATPVVKVPGCPPHPDWLVYPVAYFLIHGSLPALDFRQRPDKMYGDKAFCSKCAHNLGATRTKGTVASAGPNFEAAFLSDEGCLKAQGCKGEISFGDCPIRMKNVFDDGTANNWCVGGPGNPGGGGTHGWWNPVQNIADARHPCQGCIEPGFPDFPEIADAGPVTQTNRIKGFYNKIG
jgi:Ni,Fe-hydrogenase I small subunit